MEYLESILHLPCIIVQDLFRSYLNGLVVFPTFFNLSLNFAIRNWWSEPQSAPGLVFADCIHRYIFKENFQWAQILESFHTKKSIKIINLRCLCFVFSSNLLMFDMVFLLLLSATPSRSLYIYILAPPSLSLQSSRGPREKVNSTRDKHTNLKKNNQFWLRLSGWDKMQSPRSRVNKKRECKIKT